MEVLHGWREIPKTLKGASLAIGNFDGVHRGHRAVLDAQSRRAAGRARRGNDFAASPKFFQPDRPLFQLTPLNRKLGLLASCGLDLSAVLTFDTALATLSAESSVRDVLVKEPVRHQPRDHWL